MDKILSDSIYMTENKVGTNVQISTAFLDNLWDCLHCNSTRTLNHFGKSYRFTRLWPQLLLASDCCFLFSTVHSDLLWCLDCSKIQTKCNSCFSISHPYHKLQCMVWPQDSLSIKAGSSANQSTSQQCQPWETLEYIVQIFFCTF